MTEQLPLKVVLFKVQIQSNMPTFRFMFTVDAVVTLPEPMTESAWLALPQLKMP